MKGIIALMIVILMMTGKLSSNFTKGLQADEWDPVAAESGIAEDGHEQNEEYYVEDGGIVIEVPEGMSFGGK